MRRVACSPSSKRRDARSVRSSHLFGRVSNHLVILSPVEMSSFAVSEKQAGWPSPGDYLAPRFDHRGWGISR